MRLIICVNDACVYPVIAALFLCFFMWDFSALRVQTEGYLIQIKLGRAYSNDAETAGNGKEITDCQ